MKRITLCLLAAALAAASLSGAALPADSQASLAIAVDDPGQDCEDQTPKNPNGPNQAFCYLNWWVQYLLEEITCAEYMTGVQECAGIPD